jgi:hypothetical protein
MSKMKCRSKLRDEQFQCKYWRTATFLSSVTPPEHWLHWHRYYQHREFTDAVGVILHWIYLSVFIGALAPTDTLTLSTHWSHWYRCSVEYWGTEFVKVKVFHVFLSCSSRNSSQMSTSSFRKIRCTETPYNFGY